MDEEQEFRLTNWNEQGHAQESGAEKWSRIFKCIFQNEEHVPDPCQFSFSHILESAHSYSTDPVLVYDYLIPKHLSPQPTTVTQELPKHEDGHSEAIDPSLILKPQNLPQDTSHLRGPGAPETLQLALERSEGQYDCGFEYSVYRGTDSGYYSWANASEPQGPGGASFLNELPPPIPPSGLEPDANDRGHGNLLGIGDGLSSEPDEVGIDDFLRRENEG
jgi:hypothetical protein